jgi:predicted RNA-binding Zn-ribbon protein involved in translation (DUF1610 family)
MITHDAATRNGEKVCGDVAWISWLEPGASKGARRVPRGEGIGDDPDLPGQRCSRCGHVAKNNRNGAEFACKQCGFSIHADLNAARNISERGSAVFGRVEVNRPNDYL